MSNIREVQFAKPQSNGDLVRLLEEWLALAKDGSLQAVGIAGVKTGGVVSTEWCGLDAGWLHQMNSAILVLQHRVLNANVEPER